MPLQSLNLRAALFRGLNQLKREGILGRDVTIKKTMLDDCKGDKLEEVLVVFSTVVLQKRMASEQYGETCTSRRLALMTSLSSEEQKSLLPLAIAHRTSLTKILREKSRLRSRYREFHSLLNIKEKELSQKEEASTLLQRCDDGMTSSTDLPQDIKDQFEIHWQGDPRWKDIILNGDQCYLHDPLLDIPFSKAHSYLINGTPPDIDNVDHQSLIHDLDMRVKSQAVRLEKWKNFTRNLAVTSNETSGSSRQDAASSCGTHLNSDSTKHEDLELDLKTLTQKFQTKSHPHRSSVSLMIDSYERLISSMRRDLASIDQQVNDAASHRRIESNAGITFSKCDEPNSLRKPENTLSKTSKNLLKGPQPAMNNSAHPGRTAAKINECAPADLVSESPSSLNSINGHWLGGPRTHSAQLNGRESIAEAPNIESDQDKSFVEQNPELRPLKSKLSLMERTRKSMALASPEDTSTENASRTNAIAKKLFPISDFESTPIANLDSRETLLERTRQSMSLLPTKSRPSRKSLYPQKPLKPYPTNQFETPKKSRPVDTKFSTSPEDLFSQDANYASVFKSRPKIALSPTLSPMIDRSTELTISMGSQLGDDDHTMHLGSSPLSRLTSKVGRS